MNRASITTLAKISCGEAALRRVKMLALVAAAVVARSFVAFAAEVPTFDLHKTCKADVVAYQSTTTGQAGGQDSSQVSSQVSEQGCLKSEQSARETLVSQWTQFTPATRRECLEIQGDGATSRSYVELLTCLQMANDKTFK
jgi:hypothetical protein